MHRYPSNIHQGYAFFFYYAQRYKYYDHGYSCFFLSRTMNITKSLLLVTFLVSTSLAPCWPLIETLFAPNDRPTTRLIKEIDETYDILYAAIYYISDQKIIDALIRAHNRKVKVRIISDASTSHAIYSKVHQLVKAGIPVFVQNIKKKEAVTRAAFVRHKLMHDKFALVNNKVWTGSFNWTIGANTMNYENVIIIGNDLPTYKKYYDRFLAIERECVPFVPAPPQPAHIGILPTKGNLVYLNPVLAQA